MISRDSAMFHPRCVDSKGKWVLFEVSVARMAYHYMAMFFQQSWSYGLVFRLPYISMRMVYAGPTLWV